MKINSKTKREDFTHDPTTDNHTEVAGPLHRPARRLPGKCQVPVRLGHGPDCGAVAAADAAAELQ